MSDEQLSRRERQIMDAVFSHGEASANQVVDAIADPPSRTAVRTFLRILVEEGTSDAAENWPRNVLQTNASAETGPGSRRSCESSRHFLMDRWRRRLQRIWRTPTLICRTKNSRNSPH